MEHWLGKLQVAKMARALSHTARTSVTLELSVNSSEPRVAQSSDLRLPSLGCLTVLDLHHRHLPLKHKTNKFTNQSTTIKVERKSRLHFRNKRDNYDLVGTDNSKLNRGNFGDLSWGERESNIHGFRGNDIFNTRGSSCVCGGTFSLFSVIRRPI